MNKLLTPPVLPHLEYRAKLITQQLNRIKKKKRFNHPEYRRQQDILRDLKIVIDLLHNPDRPVVIGDVIKSIMGVKITFSIRVYYIKLVGIQVHNHIPMKADISHPDSKPFWAISGTFGKCATKDKGFSIITDGNTFYDTGTLLEVVRVPIWFRTKIMWVIRNEVKSLIQGHA